MNIPTQLHLAGADDWTPSHACKQIQHADIFEYAGATHAFDLIYPDRKMFGHTLKYDRKATALSRERVKKFLSENL
jgi:dienelactone hydrolase